MTAPTAPVAAWLRAVLCPAHGLAVAIDDDGRVIGRCDACAREAARGISVIEHSNRAQWDSSA